MRMSVAGNSKNYLKLNWSDSLQVKKYTIKNLCTLKYLSFRKYIKGKAIPLQAWTGPEFSSSSRRQDVKTIVT